MTPSDLSEGSQQWPKQSMQVLDECLSAARDVSTADVINGMVQPDLHMKTSRAHEVVKSNWTLPGLSCK